jgi:hypothetical protein
MSRASAKENQAIRKAQFDLLEMTVQTALRRRISADRRD